MAARTPPIRQVTTSAKRLLWVLETEKTAYVLGLDAEGLIQHVYWGSKLLSDTDYGEAAPLPSWAHERAQGVSQEEFLAWGGMSYTEPCLKLSAGEQRGTRLEYERCEIASDNSKLRFYLQDRDLELEVILTYHLFFKYDLIERSVQLRNNGSQNITLDTLMSARWNLPKRDHYELTHLSGRWIEEFQIQKTPLPLGKMTLESRSGITGFTANPFFALASQASEEAGEVWFGVLAYSGSWQIVLERTAHGQMLVTGGINPFDFSWRLEPGETLVTPGFVGGYSAEGYAQMSRNLHNYAQQRVLPEPAAAQRPSLYNSWYVTEFNVTEKNQKSAADAAADLGLELFVIDDGWFGKRQNDSAGLGDWQVNREKFPNGLKPLIEYVQALGMEFGIWVEPEMVNPDSDLYRAHRDWVYNFPDRPRSESRNQLVLNLARNDVQAHLIGVLDTLLNENDIRFVKWDMNRPFSEPGWPEAPPGRAQEVWLRHTQALYHILATLRKRHPGVHFESCASGGGRVDYGVMRYVDQFWLSDNTDPRDVLHMQEGFSLAYPMKTRMAWVTDTPGSLEFRFHVAMTGALGVGADISRWSVQDRAVAKRLIALYHELRPTIQAGTYFRVRSAREHALSAQQFVSADCSEAIVFIFLTHTPYGRESAWIKLRGLDPEANYKLDDPQAQTLSGKALMERGIFVTLSGERQSQLVRLRRQAS